MDTKNDTTSTVQKARTASESPAPAKDSDIQNAEDGKPMSAQKDSPYIDQQVLPGQVIGYGLPTNQRVFGQLAAPQSGKFTKKNKIIAGSAAAIIFACLTAAFLL